MIYHVVHVVLTPPPQDTSPPPTLSTGIWLDSASVEASNIGTGVKKVWAATYGSWGSFEVGNPGLKPRPAAKKRKSTSAVPASVSEEAGKEQSSGKVVRKIMMPMMPTRPALA